MGRGVVALDHAQDRFAAALGGVAGDRIAAGLGLAIPPTSRGSEVQAVV